MKKTYIIPEIKKVEAIVEKNLMAGSEGVQSGNTPGNEYNEGDVTYSRIELHNVWDEE
ncbi:MAG: hypothetical protein J6Z41_07810 [Prevotella sp.]|nr:hypothetical protein [Prevotella sp.]